MQVTILEEDWTNGVPYSKCDCMLALALLRHFPDKKVNIRHAAMCVVEGVAYFMDEKTRAMIRAFDHRESPPFAFPFTANLSTLHVSLDIPNYPGAL